MKKIRLATVRLDGCSGCHMSFLDMDERLLNLADSVEMVYSPLVDSKQLPDKIDITLIEGAISTTQDLKRIYQIREKSRLLVAFGDCAVTANISSLRNSYEKTEVLKSVYQRENLLSPQIPSKNLPALLEQALPIHHVVKVDLFVPGCPPSSNTIFYALTELIEGRTPDLTTLSRFGA